MHELQIAGEIINIVRAEMKRLSIARVSEIGLNLGALSNIDPEALKFGFEAGAIDTSLADAELKIKFISAEGKCRTCSRKFTLNEFSFICPHCGSADLEITRGEELDITYLKGE